MLKGVGLKMHLEIRQQKTNLWQSCAQGKKKKKQAWIKWSPYVNDYIIIWMSDLAYLLPMNIKGKDYCMF